MAKIKWGSVNYKIKTHTLSVPKIASPGKVKVGKLTGSKASGSLKVKLR